jgi:transcriptional regulator with XRE-family HTH domain
MTIRRAPTRTPGAYTLLVAELIARREALGLSQRNIAPAVNVGQPSIVHYESGHSVPSAPRLFLWADALDCDIVLVPREAAQ